MTRGKRWALAAVAAVLSLTLTGCSLPMMGFADYDVSGYFQALFDSCYKGENEAYMAVAATNEQSAQENNNTTVENAAVNFCNTYGLNPSEEQLTQLEDVMRQAFLQADYTVKDELKVEGGYYLDVEIDPIVYFSGLEDKVEELREEANPAQQSPDSRLIEEALAKAEAGESLAQEDEDSDGDYGSEDGYGDYGYDDSGYDDGSDYGYEDSSQEESSSSQDSSDTEDTGVVDANALFVDKVITFCQGQLEFLTHGDETVTIALDIRQTSDGELQLDTNQLDTIDRTVLQFQS